MPFLRKGHMQSWWMHKDLKTVQWLSLTPCFLETCGSLQMTAFLTHCSFNHLYSLPFSFSFLIPLIFYFSSLVIDCSSHYNSIVIFSIVRWIYNSLLKESCIQWNRCWEDTLSKFGFSIYWTAWGLNKSMCLGKPLFFLYRSGTENRTACLRVGIRTKEVM